MSIAMIDLYGDGSVVLPAKYEVCTRCHGTGSHVNPNVDGNGLSRDDMDELGPEFFEDYMSGVYDVRCEECDGDRVVAVVDRPRCDPELLAEYDEAEQSRRETDDIYRMERLMGA